MSREEANGIARAVERMRRSRRKGLKFALPTVAALGAGAAIAVGAIPGNDGTITGCYLTNTQDTPGLRIGSLRVIDPSLPAPPAGGVDPAGACLSDEATISWNQRGPQGPPGSAGSQGAQGAPGTALVGGTTFGFGGSGGGSHTFLKLDGIKGESKDKTHKGEIELSSFSLGVTQGGTSSHGSGGGAGKTSFQSFTITKKLDKASPALFLDANAGKHIKLADVSFAKRSKGKEVDYLEFKFTDVLISSLQVGQSSHGTPQESITFAFHKASETFLGSNHKALQTVSITITGNAKF